MTGEDSVRAAHAPQEDPGPSSTGAGSSSGEENPVDVLRPFLNALATRLGLEVDEESVEEARHALQVDYVLVDRPTLVRIWASVHRISQALLEASTSIETLRRGALKTAFSLQELTAKLDALESRRPSGPPPRGAIAAGLGITPEEYERDLAGVDFDPESPESGRAESDWRI